MPTTPPVNLTGHLVRCDARDASAASTRVVVMLSGVFERAGTPDEVYQRPRSAGGRRHAQLGVQRTCLTKRDDRVDAHVGI
jgi:ABC-type Fe3+/spermidine/putrescine transport system ATPase subunit